GEPGERDALGAQGLERVAAEVARVRDRAAAAEQDAKAEPAAAGLLHQLGLAEPDLGRQLGAVADDHLGVVGAGLPGPLDRELRDVAQLLDGGFIDLRAAHAWVPPTVIDDSRTVGVPTLTGTLWPSLPHVHMPSDSSKSAPSMSTRRRTSGPLPIRFTPLSGAVSLPSSIR